jgi:CHASE3 domain sensor protein
MTTSLILLIALCILAAIAVYLAIELSASYDRETEWRNRAIEAQIRLNADLKEKLEAKP